MSAVVELETKAERAKTVHFLDLKEISCLPFKTKLPTAREVICTFLYSHFTAFMTSNLSNNNSASKS